MSRDNYPVEAPYMPWYETDFMGSFAVRKAATGPPDQAARSATGTYARHYYDLARLAGQQAVLDMLNSDEYAAIKADYDRISREYCPRSYFYPADMRFSNSDALFPPAELAATIQAEYEAQCGYYAMGLIRHGTRFGPNCRLFVNSSECLRPSQSSPASTERLVECRTVRIRLENRNVGLHAALPLPQCR